MPRSRRAFATWTLLGLTAILSAAVVLTWPRTSDVFDHRQARKLILYYTLSRVDDPIVVLGDSITEASTLPRSLCGRPILNAGLNGAATGDGLDKWLSDALNGKRAALIIVALGTNDALVPSPQDKQAFADRYGALLVALSRLAPRIAITGIPPAQQQDRVTPEMAKTFQQTIEGYNAVLPEIAKRNGATFFALDDFPEPGTIDGIHLNAAGYQAWDSAVMRAAAMTCG